MFLKHFFLICLFLLSTKHPWLKGDKVCKLALGQPNDAENHHFTALELQI